VVQVGLVGRGDRHPVLEPPRDDEAGVEDRDGEHEQREEQGDGRGRLQQPSTETAASENPSSIAPESPMKIRPDRSCGAGSRASAPKTIAVKDAAVGLPSESSIT
jgi:hypothetical protein